MKSYLIFLFMVIATLSKAQHDEPINNNIESILDEALNICRKGVHLDSALIKVDSGLKLLEKNHLIDSNLIKALYIKGRIYEKMEINSEVYRYLDSAIQISKAMHMDTSFVYARCLVHYAKSCLSVSISKPQYAILALKKSIDIFNKLKDKNNALFASSHLPLYYYRIDENNEAENIIIELERSIDNTYDLAYVNYFYDQVSNYYSIQNIKDKATLYRDKIHGTSALDSCINLTNKLNQIIDKEEIEGSLNLLNNCIECNAKFAEKNLFRFTNSLNVCAEIIIFKNIKDISIADSLLEVENSLLQIYKLNTEEIVNNDCLDNIITYYFLKGNIALKKSDFITLEKIDSVINKLTKGFTDFKKLTSEQKSILLIFCIKYYSLIHDTKINDLLKTYKEIANQKLKNALSFMIESELNQFIQNKLFSQIDIFFESYDPQLMPDHYTKYLYELALYSKELLFRKSRNINKLLTTSQDSSILEIGKKLMEIDLKISSVDQSKNILLYKERDQLERKLYKLTNSEDTFDIHSIQHKLKENEIAVDFIKYKSKFGKRETEKYMALVLDSQHTFPKAIDLFDEYQLTKTRSTLSKIEDSAQTENVVLRGLGLRPIKTGQFREYQLIWEPILKLYPNIKTIYFSPVGTLNRRNLTSIPITDSTYLFNRCKLVQLTSTYNLAKERKIIPLESTSALLIGGINYGKNKSDNKDNLDWNFLEGTLSEVTQLNEEMIKKDIHTTLLTGLHVDKSTVKLKLQETHAIIHIATHGYYQELKDGDKTYAYFDSNPMQRSILVLANANDRNMKNDKTGSGYLNALEISNLDLSQSNLIVLSACETAVGENISQYESNFSLIRGFKIAGAKSILSTLYPVSDKATISFMKTFYHYLLTEGFDTNEAFIATQKQMSSMSINDTNWNAFILVD